MALEHHSPDDNARRMLDAQGRGENPDCLFRDLSNKDKMDTYRALRNVQGADNRNLPELRLYIGQGEGYHVYPADQNARDSFCREPVKRPEPARKAERSEGDDTWAQFEKIKRENAPEAAERERRRVDNPQEPASRIEQLADRALDGDQQAKLDLRRRLESLMNDRNPDYKNAVLNQMVKDGGYMQFKDAPHVVLTSGADGKPESITFSRDLGITKETIPLNQSLSEQVDEAQTNYVGALGKVTGGLGKFDPQATMRAYEILDGSEPDNLRWFMLYRKEQGRPAVDLERRH